jgi:hypothetical protein
MMTQPAYRVDRLTWVFRKSGAEGARTREFSKLTQAEKDWAASRALLARDEIPALVVLPDDDDAWAIVTDRRLLWNHASKIVSIPFESIVDACVEGGALAIARTKALVNHLTVRDDSGAVHVVTLEPGPPFVGMWNVIKSAAGWKVK